MEDGAPKPPPNEAELKPEPPRKDFDAEEDLGLTEEEVRNSLLFRESQFFPMGAPMEPKPQSYGKKFSPSLHFKACLLSSSFSPFFPSLFLSWALIPQD